jgi:hypothetical protein
MEVYVTDCGQLMDEDDLWFYLIFLMENFIKKGISQEQFIDMIWEQDFFGDSIIDHECFMAMKIRFKNYCNAYISASYQE